jgi:hypothetical protein
MMCTRGVSQDLFPVLTRFGRNCQIPHSWRHISVRFSVLQSVGIIPVPPVIGSKHGTVPPPSHWAASNGPFQAVCWAGRGANAHETGLPDCCGLLWLCFMSRSQACRKCASPGVRKDAYVQSAGDQRARQGKRQVG